MGNKGPVAKDDIFNERIGTDVHQFICENAVSVEVLVDSRTTEKDYNTLTLKGAGAAGVLLILLAPK